MPPPTPPRTVRLTFEPALSDHLDDSDDEPDDDGRDAAERLIEAAVAKFGRLRSHAPDGRPSRSMRDGHRPAAESHVRIYLEHAAGASVPELMRSHRRPRSSVYHAIAWGRDLVARDNPDRRGDRRDANPNGPRRS